MTGVELIATERQRQIEVEGWTPEGDDQHDGAELALAAACYALPYPERSRDVGGWRGILPLVPHALWPWAAEWWKPISAMDVALERDVEREYARFQKGDHETARVRELVKAGALIAAEIDRLGRMEASRGA